MEPHVLIDFIIVLSVSLISHNYYSFILKNYLRLNIIEFSLSFFLYFLFLYFFTYICMHAITCALNHARCLSICLAVTMLIWTSRDGWEESRERSRHLMSEELASLSWTTEMRNVGKNREKRWMEKTKNILYSYKSDYGNNFTLFVFLIR